MTDDDKALVERLRERGPNGGLFCDCGDKAADRIEALSAEVERRTIDGIHTCHDECQRVACVLRRENKRLREALQRITALEDDFESNAAMTAHEWQMFYIARAALGDL